VRKGEEGFVASERRTHRPEEEEEEEEEEEASPLFKERREVTDASMDFI